MGQKEMERSLYVNQTSLETVLEDQIEELESQQASLMEIEERLPSIMEAIPDGILGLDRHGVVTMINDGFTRILGFGASEVIGKTVHRLIHHTMIDGRRFPQDKCPIHLSCSDGVSRFVTGEVFWRKDGTSIPVEYTTTPILREGENVGVVVVFRDLTDQLSLCDRLTSCDVVSKQSASDRRSSDWIPTLESLETWQELKNLLICFAKSLGISAAIVSAEGDLLVASKWQRVCQEFHQSNREHKAICILDNHSFMEKLSRGDRVVSAACQNGMTECGSPIFVEGKHIANVFIGQFHVQEPDPEYFFGQANQYNFPVMEYLRAVHEAKVIDSRTLSYVLDFLTNFTDLAGRLLVRNK